MKVFSSAVLSLLLVAACSTQDVTPACKDHCDHLCTAGLTNCVDIKEGMCAKLSAACTQPCYYECTCTTGCEDQCVAQQAECEGSASDDIALVACKAMATGCKAECPAKCSVEGILAVDPYNTVKAAISAKLPVGQFYSLFSEMLK